MDLIEHYLPRFQFGETHTCLIAAPPEAVLDAVARYRPEQDLIYRLMIALRVLPSRLLGPSRKTFGFDAFTLLERTDTALIYGLVGRFWRLDFGLKPIADRAAFLACDRSDVAKLGLGFAVARDQRGMTRLVTRTCVFCPDLTTRLRFTPYWLLIRPVSGLLRRRMLALIRAAAERVADGPAPAGALSDEVDAGSAQERASKQGLRAAHDCNAIGHGSSAARNP